MTLCLAKLEAFLCAALSNRACLWVVAEEGLSSESCSA